MSQPIVSKLLDADMQAAPKALLRAARRAREIARQTNTALVVIRDGKLVEVKVGDSEQDGDTGKQTGPPAGTPAPQDQPEAQARPAPQHPKAPQD